MAGAHSQRIEAISRGVRMLRTALGPAIAAWLDDPGVVGVMLNPDGRLGIARLAEGLVDTGERLSAAERRRVRPPAPPPFCPEAQPASPRGAARLPAPSQQWA